SKNLVWYRKNMGFNQEEMARQIKVSRNQWSDYERGRSEPSISTVVRIAAFLKVSLDELLSDRIENITFENGEVVRKSAPDASKAAPVSSSQQTQAISSDDVDKVYETQREVIQTQKALIDALNDNIAFLKQRIADLEKKTR